MNGPFQDTTSVKSSGGKVDEEEVLKDAAAAPEADDEKRPPHPTAVLTVNVVIIARNLDILWEIVLHLKGAVSVFGRFSCNGK